MELIHLNQLATSYNIDVLRFCVPYTIAVEATGRIRRRRCTSHVRSGFTVIWVSGSLAFESSDLISSTPQPLASSRDQEMELKNRNWVEWYMEEHDRLKTLPPQDFSSIIGTKPPLPQETLAALCTALAPSEEAWRQCEAIEAKISGGADPQEFTEVLDAYGQQMVELGKEVDAILHPACSKLAIEILACCSQSFVKSQVIQLRLCSAGMPSANVTSKPKSCLPTRPTSLLTCMTDPLWKKSMHQSCRLLRRDPECCNSPAIFDRPSFQCAPSCNSLPN